MSVATARELLDLWREAPDNQISAGYGLELVARVERVLALHEKQTNLSGQEFCWAGCSGSYPCKTLRLLNGGA
jgi:hypothetical protein